MPQIEDTDLETREILRSIVRSSYEERPKDVSDLFDVLMKKKLTPVVDSGKEYVAQNMFKEPVEDEEEDA